MTVTSTPGTDAAAPVELVTLTIDGAEVSVPKGTLIIRAAEQIGVEIPRFCDHPLLEPVGACRQCLVDVATPGPDGQLRPMPKPQASCTIEVTAGMVVKTQVTSAVADKAQQGIMELLLINHPLDCPVCDKGGECPLQNQALSHGRDTSRFEDVKRTFPKPINISSQVLLDRERCVLCARCTRFSAQIAGDPFIELLERGALQQVGIYEQKPFESYFSGNTVQICPVGALTGAAYRFRSRPFDLVSSPGVCEHCASGCAIRSDHRRGQVLRRMAIGDPLVNEEWNCDKGRWAFTYSRAADRLTHPMVRDEETGELRVASWPEALQVAARGLAAAKEQGGVGVLVGGRVSYEDAYAYGKFARVALGTNDIDFRFRAHSAEEADFLGAAVAGGAPGNGAVTYADLERASAVLLVGFEPEDESPIVFLRLRKAVRRNGTRIVSVAPWATRGLGKLSGRLVAAAPGTEGEVLQAIASGAGEVQDVSALLSAPGAIVLVGERLAAVPGALSAAHALAESSGARLAWIPRRAGERGALEAGALPGLLPGGRPVADPAARVDVQTAWGTTAVPATPGRDTAGIVAAAAAGDLAGLVVGGVDPDDLPDPQSVVDALDAVGFLVSLEIRSSAVTERADVVLPVAVVEEKGGTFLDWEGRHRPFQAALRSNAISDYRALALLAEELDQPIGLRDLASVRADIDALGAWDGAVVPAPRVAPAEPPQPKPNQAVLATWRLLLDNGRLQDGEPYLAGTAPRPVARLSPATAAEIGVAEGGDVAVSTGAGRITLPVLLDELPDRVVWIPTDSQSSTVHASLRTTAGAVVGITRVSDVATGTTGTTATATATATGGAA
jgi:NADH-quinone oxidoreductase subunit G